MTYEVIANQHREFDKWLVDYNNGVNSSLGSAIMKLHPWVSPVQEARYLMGLQERPDISEQEKIKWGLRLETPIAEGWREETGKTIEICGDLIRSDKYNFMQCTPDFWVTGEGTTLQIKNYDKNAGQHFEEGIPEYLKACEQHVMAITDADYSYVAVLLGGNKLVWDKVHRDQAFIVQMIADEAMFWDRLKKGELPEAGENDGDAIKEMYPRDDGTQVQLSADIENAHLELAEIKSQLKDLNALKKVHENKIKMAIGEHTKGLLPNGGGYTYKLTEKKEHIVKASSYRTLRFVK